MQFNIDSIQIVIFLTAIEKSLFKIASLAMAKLPGLEGCEPFMFPLEEDAPPEIPRIRISNENSGMLFQLSPLRCEITLAPPDKPISQNISSVFDSVVPAFCDLWGELQNDLGARGNRLGLVVNFLKLSDDSISKMKNYFSVELAEEMRQIQVHYHQEHDVNNFILNHWIRLVAHTSQPKMGITMQVDVNSSTVKPIEKLDNDTIQRFLTSAEELIQSDVAYHSEKLQ